MHDVHDVEAFCRRIIQRHLRLTKATLRQHDYEDLASYLIETSWELSLKYDPALSSSFSKYAYTLLQLRVTEWYRKRFYRDQTNTDWYRKRFPNAQPASREDRENFHFPASLDHTIEHDDQAPGRWEVAAADHSERDSLGFAVRALQADPALDCDPALFDTLARAAREQTRDNDLRDPRADERAKSRNRKAA